VTRFRRLAVLTVVLAVIPLASACTSGFNALVDKSYYPADGTSADAGTVAIRNALVVASADGRTGNLVLGIVAQDTPDRLVGLSFSGATGAVLHSTTDVGTATESVLLPANKTVSVGSPGMPQIVLTGLRIPAGSWGNLTLNFANAGSATLQIPVVPGISYYADYTPPPILASPAATPTPTETSAPASSATPAPSPTSS
jgi:copper(I)-binding protein